MPTENEIQYGRKESGATGIPRNGTVDVPAASAAVRAKLATYGPKNTVPTVVLKAEFAQSYIAQPKISFLSFTIASVAMVPPSVQDEIKDNKRTRASIRSFDGDVKRR
jgi:hypothetical protein